MKSALRAAVTGLHHTCRCRCGAGVPKSAVGLSYHIISDAEVGHVLHYPFLDTAAFEADLDYLQQTFGFIAYDELVKRRGSGGQVRDNCGLQFRRRLRRVRHRGRAAASAARTECVFFVITDLIDNTVLFRETKRPCASTRSSSGRSIRSRRWSTNWASAAASAQPPEPPTHRLVA